MEKPGWVEFAPVWGRPHRPGPSDRFSENLISKVFGLAMANLRGELSEVDTQIRFARLQVQMSMSRQIETMRK